MNLETKVISGVVVGVVIVLIWICGSIARSDGKISYCFITHDATGYRVVGHRDWRENAVVAIANSPEGADKIFRESAICSGK